MFGARVKAAQAAAPRQFQDISVPGNGGNRGIGCRRHQPPQTAATDRRQPPPCGPARSDRATRIGRAGWRTGLCRSRDERRGGAASTHPRDQNRSSYWTLDKRWTGPWRNHQHEERQDPPRQETPAVRSPLYVGKAVAFPRRGAVNRLLRPCCECIAGFAVAEGERRGQFCLMTPRTRDVEQMH